MTTTTVDINEGDIFGTNDSNIAVLASINAAPNIWTTSDSLAKSFYSTIMTDLGQTSTRPNILLNATALQYFSQTFGGNYVYGSRQSIIPGPANNSYETLKNETGPLGTSTAVISTKYLCQVPQRKSTGTLFVSILIADIVFMQLLWKIFTLCSVTWLTHKDSEGKDNVCPTGYKDMLRSITANDCAGCAKRAETTRAVSNASSPSKRSSSNSEATAEHSVRSSYLNRPGEDDMTDELSFRRSSSDENVDIDNHSSSSDV